MVATIFTDKFQTYGSLARYLEFTCSRERKRDRENQFQRPVAPSEARALELFYGSAGWGVEEGVGVGKRCMGVKRQDVLFSGVSG